MISLIIYLGLFLALLFEVESTFNESIGLVLLPEDLKIKVTVLSFFDLFGSMGVEYLLH